MSWLRRAGWAVGSTAAVVAIVAPWLGPDRTIAWRDGIKLHRPVRALVVEALRSGHLPLWNPYEATGMPLFAQAIHGVLHPLSVACAAFSTDVDALLVLYLVAGTLGAYVAARAYGTDAPSAAVAAVGYGASGWALGSVSLIYVAAATATLPWIVAAARHAGTAAGAPLVAAGIACMVLGGDLQGAAVASAIALAVAAEAGGRRGFARAAAGVALGAAVAGIQLVPAWAFFERTTRSALGAVEVREQWALSPWRLLELVLPGLVGGVPRLWVSETFLAVEPGSRFGLPFAPSVYVGIPVLVSAAFGARTRSGKVLGALALACLWVALGCHAGAQQLLDHVPVWRDFRYAEKLVGPFTLCVALLAAMGARPVVNGARIRPALLALVGVASAAALAATLVPPATGLRWARVLVPRWPEPALAQVTTGLLHLTAGLVALALVVELRRRSVRDLSVPLLVLVVFAQALSASHFALHATPLDAVRSPPALESDAIVRLVTHLAPRSSDTLDAVVSRQSGAGEAAYNVEARVDNVEPYSGLTPRRMGYLYAALGPDWPLAARRFSASHVATDARGLAKDRVVAGGHLVARDAEGVEFWAVPHRPWATFAGAARTAATELESLRLTVAAARAGDGAVVLQAPELPPLGRGRVLAATRAPEEVVVEVEAESAALLVVNDAWWPGWTAAVDGAPAPLLPADVLVRAIPVPAGRHRVVMRYEPRELRWGIALSVAGTCVALLLGWRAARPSRAAPPRPDAVTEAPRESAA